MSVVGNVNGLAIMDGNKLVDVDAIERENAELRAEIERMRPVVEAADGVAYPSPSLARALREYKASK